MLSMPPATATWVLPANRLSCAIMMAFMPEPHILLIVVQALLNGEVDGEPVTEEMFAWMFILIMVGGNESTRTATSHGMRLLIEHPDQLQHLVDHPEDIPDAIEEMLRYNTAFIAMRRTATQDVEWNGHHIKKGDKVEAGAALKAVEAAIQQMIQIKRQQR